MVARPSNLSPAAQPNAAVELARNLFVARDLVGWTQGDLVERSGVSRATVGQIESATTDPRLSTLVAIADALGIPLFVLLADRRQMRAIAEIGPALASRPVAIDGRDQHQMAEHAAGLAGKDWREAARIGAAIGRSAGCTSPGAVATAGLFSVAAPGRGTAVGATLGRLLE